MFENGDCVEVRHELEYVVLISQAQAASVVPSRGAETVRRAC